MSFERQVTFWVAAAALFLAALWLFGNILLPFVGGMALAYLLNPLANRMERAGWNRAPASVVLIVTLVVCIVALIVVIVPVIGTQLAGLLENLPSYIRRLQDYVTDPSRPWLSRLVGEGLAGADQSIGTIVKQSAGWATGVLASLWTGGQALLSVFSLLVVTPVVAFYFLLDWPRLIETVDGLVPVKHRDTVRRLAYDMDCAVAGFVRGQTLVCLIQGVFYATALTLVGLNYGAAIGLLSGLIGFIPYVGSITGFVLSTGVALAQFWPEWIWIAAVIGIFIFGQFVEGNFLVPKLVGDSAGLHPLWLMFALFAFGYLFGFVGLLLAVPIAAAMGVLARFAVERYRQSALYTGEELR